MRYIALFVLVLAVAACSSSSHTAPAPATSTVTVTATPAYQTSAPTVPSSAAPSTTPTPTLQSGCLVETHSSRSDIKITLMNDGTQTVYVSVVTYYLFDSSGNLMSHEDDTQFPQRGRADRKRTGVQSAQLRLVQGSAFRQRRYRYLLPYQVVGRIRPWGVRAGRVLRPF